MCGRTSTHLTSVIEVERAVGVLEQGTWCGCETGFYVVESVVRSKLPPDPAGDPVVQYAVGLIPTDNGGSPDPLTVLSEIEPGTEDVRSLLGFRP